jgi:hypothetical protein
VSDEQQKAFFQPHFNPAPGDLLYHYCSMEAFHAIISSGRLRFSDINLMNDYAEMTWGYKVFELAASRILGNREKESTLPDKAFLDKVDAHLAPANLAYHPLVSCFSKKPDVLSQWRGYAADGAGVCIGFDATSLLDVPAHFLECRYDLDHQVDCMEAHLIAMHKIADEFSMHEHASHLFGTLPSFKNSAFVEEEEVRAVHMLTVKAEGEILRLEDPGGNTSDGEFPGQEVEFRLSNGSLISYLDLPFGKSIGEGVVREVWLGPKNINAWTTVSIFLASAGYMNVDIKKSKATYR